MPALLEQFAFALCTPMSAPPLAALLSLRLSGTGLLQLPATPFWGQLTALDLSNNAMGGCDGAFYGCLAICRMLDMSFQKNWALRTPLGRWRR